MTTQSSKCQSESELPAAARKMAELEAQRRSVTPESPPAQGIGKNTMSGQIIRAYKGSQALGKKSSARIHAEVIYCLKNSN